MLNLVFNLKWTPIFEGYMIGCESKTDIKKTCVEKRITYLLVIC